MTNKQAVWMNGFRYSSTVTQWPWTWVRSRECAHPHGNRPCSVQHTLPAVTPFQPGSIASSPAPSQAKPAAEAAILSPFVPTGAEAFSVCSHKQAPNGQLVATGLPFPSLGR